MPVVKAIVFDQDGTLINTFIPAMHAYGIAVGREITYEQLKPFAHLGAARNLVSALLGRPATDTDDDRFHEALREAVGGIHPYTGVVELLAHLRDRGVPTAVATNSDSRSAGIVLGTHGLQEYFQTVVTVDRVGGVPKPAPDSLLLAAKELGVAASEVAFVGDSSADMAAARAAGAHGVAAGWGQQVADVADFDFWAVAPRDVLNLLQ